MPIELGAEFVHGEPLELSPFPAIETEGEDWCVRDGRLEKPGALFRSVERLMADLPAAPEQPFAEFVKSNHAGPEARMWTTGYVEGFHAAPAADIGVCGLALTNRAEAAIGGGRSFRLAGGYSSLIDRLRSEIAGELLCGVAVQAVSWSRGRVAARAPECRREFHAARLICTIPLGVLASGDVCFEPEPPNLRAALRGIATGRAARITFRFRRRVWEDRSELQNLGFLFSREAWMPTWWTASPSDEPILTGWTGGPHAAAAPEDIAEWVEPALSSLAKSLGRDAAGLRRELIAWHAHNWSADPFSRGAYSYVRPGGLDALRGFGAPVEDTLFFAGEAANAEGYWATVHGAVASGERAARLALERMGVQSV